MLPSRQYFRALVNETELTQCQVYTERFQKQASSSLFYSLQLFIDLLGIYYQCLTSFYKATWQEKWISAMKELETGFTLVSKPALSTRGGGYFIEVQLL